MPPPLLLLLLLDSVAVLVSANAQADPTESSISFRPSVAIVIGIFAIMFSLTFLLLIYAKFCHGRGGRGGAHLFFRYAGDSADDVFMSSGDGAPASSRGVDKAVVESLPFFRFSALRGKRDGLECAVCLSKFVDADVLRLLPRCKHAFHVGCVDRWLESRSTCPLCRYRIDPDDAATLRCSSSSRRLLFRDGSNRAANDDDIGNRSSSILELFVEREHDKLLGVDKREELLLPNDVALLHRHKHKIIMSGAVFKSRWSDLNSSDLLSLDSEMLLSMVSNRHFPDSSPDKEELGEKRLLENNTTGNRCMSEMTSVSRFRSSGTGDDDKVRRLWLPIAQRTVQLFAGGQRRPEYADNGNDVTIA